MLRDIRVHVRVHIRPAVKINVIHAVLDAALRETLPAVQCPTALRGHVSGDDGDADRPHPHPCHVHECEGVGRFRPGIDRIELFPCLLGRQTGHLFAATPRESCEVFPLRCPTRALPCRGGSAPWSSRGGSSADVPWRCRALRSGHVRRRSRGHYLEASAPRCGWRAGLRPAACRRAPSRRNRLSPPAVQERLVAFAPRGFMDEHDAEAHAESGREPRDQRRCSIPLGSALEGAEPSALLAQEIHDGAIHLQVSAQAWGRSRAQGRGLGASVHSSLPAS